MTRTLGSGRLRRLRGIKAVAAGSVVALAAPLGVATIATVTAPAAGAAPVTIVVSGDAGARNVDGPGTLTWDGTDFDDLKTLLGGGFGDATFDLATVPSVATVTDAALADVDVYFSSAVGDSAGTDYEDFGYTPAEEAALLRFVQRGGVLIANTNDAQHDVTRFLGDDPAPAGTGQIAVDDPAIGTPATTAADEATPVGTSSFTDGVTAVTLTETYTRFDATTLPASGVALLEAEAGTGTAAPVLAYVPFGTAQFGGGAIFMSSDPDIFSDAGFADPDNAALAENIFQYVADQGAQGFTSITPARIYDTRNAIGTVAGKVPAGQSRDIQVTGAGGVPIDATAVALNVTATNQAGAGFFTVYPTGRPKPNTSNVNIPAGLIDTANAAVVQIGTDGKVTVHNENNATDLVVDVTGYWSPDGDGLLTATSPQRIFDTRNNVGTTAGKLKAAETRTVTVRGQGGVPNDATGVVLNVTATNGTRGGFLTVHDSTTVPNASSVNFQAEAERPNLVFANLAADGTVRVTNAFGETDAILDVFGYFTPSSGSSITAFGPERLLDTRNAIGGPTGKVASNGTVTIDVNNDAAGDAPQGATAVLLNVTVNQPGAAGFLTVHPENTLPNVSNVNFEADQTVPNLVLGVVGTDGKVRITNTSPGTSHVIADVFAWF